VWLKWWGPALVYAVVIFVCSSISDPPSPPGPVTDKDLHFALFAGLAVVVLRALTRGRWREVTTAATLQAVAITTAYGASDEWHQHFVPGRSADPRDLLADAIGAIVAVLIVWLVGRWARGRVSGSRELHGKPGPL
jgi:VanZ family protein